MKANLWTCGATMAALAAGSAAPASGQGRPVEFDVRRAFLPESTGFTPFYVTATRSLRDALREGMVREETPLLVIERSEGRIALSTEQMTFHHAAQGDLNGVPWMVSF